MMPGWLLAQNSSYTRQVLGTRDGLLSPKIYSLLQDASGYLWIGSELGVSRYNGYEFYNIQYTDRNQLIGKILCLAQDSTGAIWLGGDKGLFYFNNDTLHQVTIKNRHDIAVESLAVDANGNLWIGELTQLYLLDGNAIQLQANKPSNTLDIKPFIAHEFRSIALALDPQNNLYAASYEGVFGVNKQHKLDTIWQNPNPQNEVVSVAAISRDTLLLNRNDGPITALLRGRELPLKPKLLIGRKVIRYGRQLYALSSKTVEIFCDGEIKQEIFFEDLTNHVTAVIIDKEKNIWIGSWEGLLKFSQTAFTSFPLTGFDHKDFFSMLENNDGKILIGGNRGTIYEYKNISIQKAADLPKPFERAEIKCIYQHTDNSYWLGSGYEGIAQIKNNTVTHWNEHNILPDNTVEALLKTKDGRLFASTEKGVTVIHLDSLKPIGEQFLFKNQYTRSPKLMGCIEINGQYIFYGNQGLFRLVNKQLLPDSIKGFAIQALYINSVTSDKNGTVWIATQGKGLLQCGFSNNQLFLQKQWLQQDGLTTDIILSALTDKNNNIWISGYAGISLLLNKQNSKRIVNFTSHDGLLSTYYQHLKLEQQKNGTIWGLSSMGLFYFHPDSIHTNTAKPTLFITDIVASNVSNNEPQLTEHLSTQAPATLPYNHNSLQFLFTAISLTNPEQIRYSYRLKGFEDKWIETKNREASFSFLPPGNYTFELLACNNSNVWTDSAIVYRFTILPPFWQTWWFRIVAAMALAIVILMIVKRRIGSVKKEAAIKQQMAELEAKALRAQMNPHFIFNSLNAIQECIITEKVEEAYEYLSKFSRLLRLVLNNSEREFITLSSEIEMTKLYLSLESLRFRQSFVYDIVVDENLDTDFIKIPSMLVQPFVENAVWHGLRHKAGEKKLLVRFNENANRLVIDIEDNGVGRQKAASIKKQKLGSEQFDSKGSVLSQQRLDILNRQYPMMAKINITDLTDETGAPNGTRATIVLPLDLQKQTPG